MTRLSLMLCLTVSVLCHAAPTFNIAGVVVDHRSHTPLPSILVSITPVNKGQTPPFSVLTGATGTFNFPNLTAGKYSLSAQKRGEQPRQFHGHEQFSTAVVAGPDLDSEHIVFPFVADARLSGLVLDEDGDPVSGALILLLQRRVVDGKREVGQAGGQSTSSTGAYHFGHLTPGLYYLAVSARPWYASHQPLTVNVDGMPAQTGRSDLDMAYPVTYSGDTTDPSSAQLISLPEGGTATLQINLHSVPAVRIAFPEAEATSGTPNSGRMLRSSGGYLKVIGPGGAEIQVQMQLDRTTLNGTDAVEEIAGIAPGVYKWTRQTVEADGKTTSSEEVINASAAGSQSPTKIFAVTVQGHVVFDGPRPEGNIGLQVNSSNRAGAMILADGTFNFWQAILAGHHPLTLMGAKGLRIKSIAVGEKQFTGNVLDIPPSAANPLEVTLTVGSASTSNVSGTAVRNGNPVAGAMILLVPRKSGDAAFIGRDQSDSDGTFEIPEVESGEYTLLAIDLGDDAADLEYREPSVLTPYLSQGQSISVPAKPLKVQVTAAHTPRS